MKKYSQTSFARSFGIFSIALITFALCAPDAVMAQFGSSTLRGHDGSGLGGGEAVKGPAATYSIDDGTAEDSVGAGANPLIFMNSFAVTAGNNIITSISIAWGTPAFPDPSLNGLPYTAVLWSDPNGDGSPVDGVVLATAPGVIALQGTNTFIVSPIAPTMVLTPNFFVGYFINSGAGQFPGAFDETAPLPNRSFAKIGNNINDLSGTGPIEVITGGALVGNWMIRADAVPEPQTWAMVGFGALMLVGVRRFLRKNA